ncbi:MAG TPA: ComEC/Rec2 family competence protein [Anaerolineales bacterium]|nr:ComEC/Rec2 family competence protein [Anaerolineales bacterium]
MALAWAAVAWATGLSLAPVVGMPVHAWVIQAFAAVACCILFRRARPYLRLFALLSVLFLGAARAQASEVRAHTSTVAAFNDLPIVFKLRGVVVEPPTTRGRTTRAVIEAEALTREAADTWRDVDGRVQLETREVVGLEYGDLVLVRGWMATPENMPGFPQQDYLAQQGVFSLMRAVRVDRLAVDQASPVLGFFYRVRARALEVFARSLPAEEASLVSGVVLGADESMPQSMREAFAQTGTTHILAVSGFNVSLVAGTVTAVLGRWLGARRGAISSAVAIGAYTLLVGAEPSAVRAALMSGLAILAKRLGRTGSAVAFLAATAILMTAATPALIADIGFQLSFAATIGLVFVAEPLEFFALRAFGVGEARRPPPALLSILREAVLLTLAAQFATLPLLAFHFGRVPLTALPANFLILPVQPALMSLGGLAALTGMVWMPAGQVFAWMAWPFAAFTLRVVELASRLPGASLAVGPMSAASLAAAYGLMGAGLLLASRIRLKANRRPAVSPWVATAILAVLTAFVWRLGLDAPEGALRATLYSSGDVLIETPSGRFILVRPASASLVPVTELGRRLPLVRRSLDWIVLPTESSVEGYAAGGAGPRLLPTGIVSNGSAPELYGWPPGVKPPRLVTAQQGLRWDLGQGATLELLAISREGAAFRLMYGRARWILLAGFSLDSMEQADLAGVTAILADSPARLATIDASTPAVWISAVGGEGLPAAPSVEGVYSTALSGWIELRTDGYLMRAEAEQDGR